MKLTNANIKTLIIVVLSIVLLLSFRKCSSYKDESVNWKGKYDFATQSFDSLKNKQGLQVVEQKPAVFTDDREVKKLSAEVFNLKRKNEKLIKEVNAFVSTKQEVKVEDKVIPYDSTDNYTKANDYLPIDNLNKDSVIIPPKKFISSDSNFYVKGTVLLQGVKIDSLSLTNHVSWRIAEKKKGLFSKRETVVQAINSNPYFTNTGINSAIVKHKPNAWNRWIKPTLVGVAASYLTYKIVNK